MATRANVFVRADFPRRNCNKIIIIIIASKLPKVCRDVRLLWVLRGATALVVALVRHCPTVVYKKKCAFLLALMLRETRKALCRILTNDVRAVLARSGWERQREKKVERWIAEGSGKTIQALRAQELARARLGGVSGCVGGGAKFRAGVCLRSGSVVVRRIAGNKRLCCLHMCTEDVYNIYIYQIGRYSTTLSE